MNCYLLRWICLFMQLVYVAAKLWVLVNKVDVTDLHIDPFKAFEGDEIILECISDRSNATVAWIRNYAITYTNTLTMKNVRLVDKGEYLCTGRLSDEVENKYLFLDVLYPPSYPKIEGTASGFVGEQVTLKCISNANPQPAYQWRRGNKNGALLSRNQTFRMTIPEDNQLLVCIAHSRMVTTFGRSKSAPIYREISILSYAKANILRVGNSPSLVVKEGEDVDIVCAAVGRPAPDVWWTKVENESFFFEGHNLIQNNIDNEFTGIYDCHAQNVGLSVNKTVITTYQTKPIHIKVTEASSSLSIVTNKGDIKDKDLVITIAAGLGWATVIIILSVNIFCCMLKRKKKTVQDKETEIQTDVLLDMCGYTYPRSLPETPSSYITEVRFPESIYFDIKSCDMSNSRQNGKLDISPIEQDRSISSETESYIYSF